MFKKIKKNREYFSYIDIQEVYTDDSILEITYYKTGNCFEKRNKNKNRRFEEIDQDDVKYLRLFKIFNRNGLLL